MNVLKTTTDPQELRIIPRRYIENVTMRIIDDNTRVETVYNTTSSLDSGYMVITENFSLSEGRFYTLKVENGTDTLFWGRILCTDSDNLQHYDMGNNHYTASADGGGIIYI